MFPYYDMPCTLYISVFDLGVPCCPSDLTRVCVDLNYCNGQSACVKCI